MNISALCTLLTVLLDEQEFDLDFLDIKGGRVSRGHRFLGQETKIQSALSYEEDLREQFVIADPREREQMIIDQIKAIEAEHVCVSKLMLIC